MNEKKREKKSIVTTVSLGLAIVVMNTGSAMAQAVYPERGQSPQQQQRDENQCSSWATQQTGYQPSGSSSSDGGIVSDRALRGAARGAGVGAIGGLIGGSAGTGAAVGAAVGGISGGIRNHDEKAARKEFDRAFAACMEGRGYTVR
ncbi:MAG: glycine zipper family protein [Xenococcaceae cyanobacterium]